MKRVGLFLGVRPHMGGMFVYAQSLLNALRPLAADGWRIDVAYVDASWQPMLAAYPFGATRMRAGRLGLVMALVSVMARLPGSMARWLAWHFNPIPKQLARLGCDIWIFPAMDAISGQVRVPVLATVHDLMHRYERSFPEVSQFGRWGIREHRFRCMLARARGVLVDSEVGRHQVVESYGTPRQTVFPLPYVPPPYIYEPEPADFDRRYSLPAKFIFYPARFMTHKNHKRLVSAAAALKDRHPDIALVFTESSGPGYDDVKAHATRAGMLDRITFIGRVPGPDLVGFYRRARALVMPTFFGPTNIPPLEAFTLGCPAAVSNIYGMPAQVDGAALLFDPTSVDDMSAVMARLWTDDALCRTLAAKGRENIERWGPAQFSDTLRGILERLS